MVIIEGPRNVGKTFLLSHAGMKEEVYKFSVSQFFDPFSLNIEERMYGFSLGKDFQIMKLNKDGFLSSKFIMDRGFISSIVYGILSNRFTEQEGLSYFYYIMEHFWKDNVHVIYIEADCEGNSKREKDRWDGMDFKRQVEFYKPLIGLLPVRNVTRFCNSFNQESVEQFKNIIREILV